MLPAIAGYISGLGIASGVRLITARHVIEGIRRKGLTETFNFASEYLHKVQVHV
jgi:hypothetical protein